MPRQTRSPVSGYESPDEEHPPSTAGLGTPRDYFSSTEKTMMQPPPTFTRPTSLNGVVDKAKSTRVPGKVGFRDRLGCFQWTWFTMTMATGGIANVLFTIPYQSRWLTIVGTVFFLFNIVLFLTNCILITMRFRFHPGSFIRSFTDQVESLFIAAFIVSIAIIFLNICEYGVPFCGPWLLGVLEVLYWLLLGTFIFASAGIYLILWSTQVFPLHTMTPLWIFPGYPLLLSAPIAGGLIHAGIESGHVESLNAVAVATASVAVQGTGFLISFMVCAAFLYRLMTQKLPRDAQRPGVFISIGPSGFTVAGIVHLGNQAANYLPPDFMGTDHSVFILKLIALMIGLCLWGLSVWFFLVSVGSLWKYCNPAKHHMPFQMTWFSFVFPNTALATATFQLGKAFDNTPLKTAGTAFAACLIVVWLFVFLFMMRALWNRQLLWPKDDD